MIDNWMRLFDMWNPWVLRRKIIARETVIEELQEKISYLWRDQDDYVKRIESLESELRLKERQCELSDEDAKHNFKEKEKELCRTLSEISVAIELLQEVVERGYYSQF